MKKINSEETLLVDSIIAPELKSVTQEFLELGIDQMIDNEFVKKIPIIGTLSAGYKTFILWRDRQLLKKIFYFLFEQTKVSEEDRKNWLTKFNKQKDKKKIEEITLELIDKVTSAEKAKILGILFRNQIKREISTQEFIRMAEMIEAIYRDDLDYFLKNSEEQLGEMGDEVDHLLSTGFLLRGGKSIGGGEYFPNKKPEHSNYGKIIYKILKREKVVRV